MGRKPKGDVQVSEEVKKKQKELSSVIYANRKDRMREEICQGCGLDTWQNYVFPDTLGKKITLKFENKERLKFFIDCIKSGKTNPEYEKPKDPK